MTKNCTFHKSLIVSLSLVISLVMTNNAQATYFFEWGDAGEEWYTLPDVSDPITVKADKWQGFFTLPDSAVTYHDNSTYYHEGPCYDVELDLTQYLDFSLSGKLISGNYMEATAFHGDIIFTGVFNDSRNIVLDFFADKYDKNITYVMANPSWMNTPLYLTITGDDHWFYYYDMVYDAGANSMESAFIAHDGYFVGHYIDDAAPPPVPEPATMLLLGCGLAVLVSTRLRKRK